MSKTIFITGASSGIGKATAKVFAANGWNVIASMRDPEKETELTALDRVLVTRLDVREADTITAAIRAGLDRFGRIDVWMNNAGLGVFGVFEATPQQKIIDLFEVNLFGVMAATRAILPHFRARQEGLIVNISSATGRSTFPLLSAYCASKFALEGFSEALSFELSSQGIGVKIIEPGMVETNFDEASRQNSADAPLPEDYNAYLQKMIASYTAEETHPVSAADAASAIYAAVTDGTDTLRYVIGEDARGMLSARSSMPDQDYLDAMRQRFTV
ncbi:SDR family oxidoreductase [Compostibacter hankyongensis]|uniref:SDR family oxidoreductase n=1 Tax=Compostibacter hankyongensis TaxID=1007089 RepID=A0ABP8G1D1_9BACT